jgi:IclR family mhp operon transcriptional activator
MTNSFKPVDAVIRALNVLRSVNDSKDATVSSIFHATDIDKATIVRMLETLVHEGYVSKDAENSTYHPTGKTLQLSQGYDWSRTISQIAGPILQHYRLKVGWPSDIAVFDRDAMVIADTSREGSILSLKRAPGYRLPMLGTSAGLAYLAFLPPVERQRVLERVRLSAEGFTDLAADPAACEKLFEVIRARGYATMTDEYSNRISGGALWAMAVPIQLKDHVFGALNLIMIRNAVSETLAVKKYLPSLRKAARSMADNLQTAIAKAND